MYHDATDLISTVDVYLDTPPAPKAIYLSVTSAESGVTWTSLFYSDGQSKVVTGEAFTLDQARAWRTAGKAITNWSWA